MPVRELIERQRYGRNKVQLLNTEKWGMMILSHKFMH